MLDSIQKQTQTRDILIYLFLEIALLLRNGT